MAIASLRRILFVVFLLTSCWAAADSSPGESIFRDGVLPGGKPLVGERAGDINLQGQEAACATCHRRSGLGTAEGRTIIPPIIGKYLFRPGPENIRDGETPHVLNYNPRLTPYTEQTLARALREGLGRDGKPLSYVMPHYDLDDAAMASLIEYLRGLSSGPFQGVTEDTLHFATIVTPDADPLKRQGMLDVLNRFFEDKNSFIRGGHRPMQSSHPLLYRVSRRWQLHVWELQGPSETWEAQLQQKLKQEPVLAVISGVGGSQWSPVHRFCQAQSLPCLFPNVDVPVLAENDFYPVYFSKGVLLEAEMMAQRISNAERTGKIRRVVQVYRKGGAGETAATSLSAVLAKSGRQVVDVPLQPSGATDSISLGRQIGADDVLVLWLSPGELKGLSADPPVAREILLSGLLAGLEDAPLPAAWRRSSVMTYPFDLPDLRKIRMNYPLGWFKVRGIPVVSERVQADTYVACGILAETLNEMLDSFMADYLVERLEVMVSHRIVNGYYPRLGLAQGQRFASKGGYWARFQDSSGTRLVADGEWVVP